MTSLLACPVTKNAKNGNKLAYPCAAGKVKYTVCCWQDKDQAKTEADELADIDLSDPDLHKAATKIQASFRGHKVRKEGPGGEISDQWSVSGAKLEEKTKSRGLGLTIQEDKTFSFQILNYYEFPEFSSYSFDITAQSALLQIGTSPCGELAVPFPSVHQARRGENLSCVMCHVGIGSRGAGAHSWRYSARWRLLARAAVRPT